MIKVLILVIFITWNGDGKIIQKTAITTRQIASYEEAILTVKNDKATSEERGYSGNYYLYEVNLPDGPVVDLKIREALENSK